ncbi:MAG: hypothetical protein LLF95_10520 [Bacteroidales bacterium]|nr:hypothetical protein [Bacteroidales bacterium]
MEKDKAIIKALKSTQTPQISVDFQTQTMNKVFKLSEQKRKRAYILNFCLISTVSLGLIVTAVFLLKDYLSFSFKMPAIQFTSSSISLFAFSFYIASLILILVGLDSYFRHKWLIKNQDKQIE